MAEQWNPFRVSPGLMSYEDMWRWAPQARTPGVGGLLQNQLDPDIVKRGMMLPWGRTSKDELKFAVPEIGLSLARSAALPGHVARGGAWTPEDVTEMAGNVTGTGYIGGGLLTGVPKGAVLGANVWHGGPNRWMPEPGYPQGRPLLKKPVNWVSDEAERVAERLRKAGMENVTIDHSGSSFGLSSYIKAQTPRGSRHEFRVSDHGVGQSRLRDLEASISATPERGFAGQTHKEMIQRSNRQIDAFLKRAKEKNLFEK